ncbi:MAG TPA: STAS domain-containing protein [Planctomycetota bacterium]|nr:STAS domain-containing protein [Planctomycetota bacterium]
MEPIRVSREGATLCICLGGRLAQDESAALIARTGKELTASPGPLDLLLDLTEVEYMTSSAVGAVVLLYQQVRLGGGHMAVAAPNERVHLLLEIAGLNQLLALCRTAAEARQALSQGKAGK